MKNWNMLWRSTCAALIVCAYTANASIAQDLDFHLIAGGADGDGGSALQASLPNAGDLAYDAHGNLYVSVLNNNRIRKIAPNGTITTVVGGITGFGGDGGPASAAKIDRPDGIAFDAAGNLYFADSGNRRIRKIATNGTISTYAGNGGRSSSGDGGSAIEASFASVERIAFGPDGSLYVAEAYGNRVRRILPNGTIVRFAGTGDVGSTGDNGPATSATLAHPMGVAVGLDGTVYIADTNNNAIRAVTADGTITTFDTVYYAYPNEITIAPAGNLFIGDTGNCVILSIPVPGGGGLPNTVSGLYDQGCGTAVDGQSARSQKMGTPDGIAFDGLGNFVYADRDLGQIRRVAIASGVVGTLAGSTGQYADGRNAIGAPIGYVFGIAVDDAGNVLLTDNGYRRVHRVTAAGTIEAPVGTGLISNGTFDCPAPVGCNGKGFGLTVPWGIAAGDVPGELLFSDRAMDRIYRVSATGTLTTYAGSSTGSIGAPGPALSSRIDPYGIARAPSGALYLSSQRANVVQRVEAGALTNVAGSLTAASSGDGGPAAQAALWHPQALAVDDAGDVYVAEYTGARVRKFTPGGNITTLAGNGTVGAAGDGGPATSASVGVVSGIAVHGADTYIASEGALRRIDAQGIIHAVPGWTHRATGLAVRGDMLYIATAEGRVYRASLAEGTSRPVNHDYDGDGHSDILWRNGANGSNTVWRSANNASQLAVTGVTNLAWKVVGQGDFDSDGKDDIAWRNTSTGANTIWRSANNATQIAMPMVSLSWGVAGVGDFDGDGADDLLWRNAATGANAVWRSGNSATQLPVTGVSNLQWRIVGVGDFDGDGRSDILWRNAASGANTIWRSANNATQIAVTGVANPAWKVQGVGDFDGDGIADVFWRNVQTGGNTIWNGAQHLAQRTTLGVTGLSWNVVAVGDYDADGNDDLLWRNPADGRVQIWRSGNAATQQGVVAVTNTAWSIVPATPQP